MNAVWGGIVTALIVALPSLWLGIRNHRAQQLRDEKADRLATSAGELQTKTLALTEMETALESQREWIEQLRDDRDRLFRELAEEREARTRERGEAERARKAGDARFRIAIAHIQLLRDLLRDRGLTDLPDVPPELTGVD